MKNPALGTQSRGEPIQTFLAPMGTPRLPRISHGEGIYMWDTGGKRYIDVSSGPVANNLGHANPRVLAAMQAQAARTAFAFPGMFESEANADLARLLTDQAGPGFDQAFFVSGGSEAVESAVKFARQYALSQGQPQRWKVISREPGYHGGTMGALALTGDKHQHEVFGPLIREMPKVPAPFTYRLPPNHTRESYARHCAAAVEERILAEGPETVLAMILEPVGGLATGALVAEAPYLDEVRAICSRHGVLLIFDEVMSGAGRTGSFLASDHWPNARPDLVVLAKGIAAGYTPMGCLLAPDHMVRAVADGGGFMNGFTYFANPLSCAIGLAVLQEMVDQDLVANAAHQGAVLAERLRAMIPHCRLVGDVRGLGLLLAVELVADQDSKRRIPLEMNAPAMVQRIAMEEGLALYARRTSRGAYGDWLMITPPLIVTGAQVDEIADGLARVLARFDAVLRAAGV
jgi:adenosylmethionine-8-amino-7-oxononanoate aminotransferase